MAFGVLTPVIPGSPNRLGKFTFDTVAAVALDGSYIGAAYTGPVSISAVASTASASSIQITNSSQADIDAGAAIWVDAVGLTAIGTTAKAALLAYPCTAWRVNVTGALAGSLRVDVFASTYQTQF
jgi:hypothetical protein